MIDDDDSVYDCFPLGRSLREHMTDFVDSMHVYIDCFDPHTRAPLLVMAEQLENLLKFHDRESAFYGAAPADLVKGAWQARVYAVDVGGVHSVQLWIGAGGTSTPIAAPIFDLDCARELADGIHTAIAQGAGE